jgi:hypothetical protein
MAHDRDGRREVDALRRRDDIDALLRKISGCISIPCREER